MSRTDAFYLDEYKSLRQEIDAKLRSRLDFNRWGLIGLAGLYSYILSHPGKPALFGVPVWLSMAMLAHLNEEHSIVAKAGAYIREQLEPWARGGDQIPGGWEKYLEDTRTPFWRRWPWRLWGWSPVPLWLSVLVLTVLIAAGVSAGWLPSLVEPPASCSS
jgi:hypothetical protein